MKVNLGCGDDVLVGYVNLDARPTGDVVGDVTQLPWDDASITEMRAMDILEHFPVSRTSDILHEWRRVLSVGALMVLRVPNMQALGDLISHDDGQCELYIRNVYGGHRWGYDGSLDSHLTGWTPRLLELLLQRCGFEVHHNDRAINMTVTGVAI